MSVLVPVVRHNKAVVYIPAGTTVRAVRAYKTNAHLLTNEIQEFLWRNRHSDFMLIVDF